MTVRKWLLEGAGATVVSAKLLLWPAGPARSNSSFTITTHLTMMISWKSCSHGRGNWRQPSPHSSGSNWRPKAARSSFERSWVRSSPHSSGSNWRPKAARSSFERSRMRPFRLENLRRVIHLCPFCHPSQLAPQGWRKDSAVPRPRESATPFQLLPVPIPISGEARALSQVL